MWGVERGSIFMDTPGDINITAPLQLSMWWDITSLVKRVRPGCVRTPSVWEWSSDLGKDGDCDVIDVNSAPDESAKESSYLEVTYKCRLLGLTLLLALAVFAHM